MLLGLGKTITFGQKRIYPYATGGDYVYLYEEGNKTYRVHEFHTTGTSTLNVEVGGQVEYLVVGGGGGGGRGRGGGGGGGGALYGSTNVSEENITISVGAGGTGAIYSPASGARNGMDSSFNGIFAYGGGFGGFSWSQYTAEVEPDGGTGGAGGGGIGVRNSTPGTGAPGITGQGYAGGAGSNSASTTTSAGGGGGGAGETGQDASVGVGGNGGSGIEWPTGSGNYYGGGGGGYVESGTPGSGGTGGGGAGAISTNDGANGLTNTGGGGGGGGGSFLSDGGNGGSGIVIVRYVIAEKTLWTPSELTSLKAWYKADSLSLSDGDPVSTWNDDSGNGYNLTGTGTGRPLFQTNIINGLPVIEFDGTDDFLQASTASDWSFMHSGAAGNSFFAVALSNYTTTTYRGSLAWTGPFTSAKRGWTWTHEGGNGFGQRDYVLVSSGSVGAWVVLNKGGYGSLPPSVPIMSSQIGDPTNATASERSSIRIDGGTAVEANTQTNATSSSDPDSPLTLGKNGDSGMAWLDGWFGELIFYDTKLNDTDRQKLEGYLAHKWGLTHNLPSGHPYKYEPPYKEEPEEIVTDGLVLNLDAGDYASYPRSGTTWYDISGNGLNGTLTNGPTYDSANKGSIVFDGSNDYVDISNTSFTGEFTFSAWIKRIAIFSAQMIFGEDSGSNSGGQKIGFDGSNYFVRIVSSAATLAGPALDTWTHMTVTRDSQNKVDLYINGGSANRLFSDAAQSGTYTLDKIGANGSDGGQNFDGNISVVHVYDRALSSTEIQQNYDALKGRYGL